MKDANNKKQNELESIFAELLADEIKRQNSTDEDFEIHFDKCLKDGSLPY